MGIFDTVKVLTDIARQIDNAPLQRQIIDLNAEAVTLYKDNEKLRKENLRLKTAFRKKGQMKVGNDHLWELDKQGKVVGGPYCVTCWERNQEALSMVFCENRCDVVCPICRIPLLAQKPPEKFEAKAYA